MSSTVGQGAFGSGESSRPLLIVDRDADYACHLARDLVARGREVDLVSTLEEAKLALAGGVGPDIVVDPWLPDGNGFDLLPLLKGTHPHAVAVVASYHLDVRMVAPALRAGAADVFSKPVSSGEIEAALNGMRVVPETLPGATVKARRIAWTYMQEALRRNGTNVARTARELGLDRSSLLRAMRNAKLEDAGF